MSIIYFDNAATTRAYPEVADLVATVMREDYGNPSSMHIKGVEAERYLRNAGKTLAGLLKCKEKEIVFTSGGTESDNWAVIGAAQAQARRGRHLITTPFEHSAVSAPVSLLEEQGWEVTRLAVDGNGRINLAELADAIREDTTLVSIMFVNNEIGAVQDIEAIGKLIKEKNPHTLFHTDAVQAFGKIPVLPKRMKIDLLSASAHKFHGPKGVGFLFIDEKVKLDPMIRGGGQQQGLRSGTDNVPGIAGMALAAKIICERMESNAEHMHALQEKLAEGLLEVARTADSPVRLLGPGELCAPHILAASFPGVRSEVLLHALEEKGICVSAGSACASHGKKTSATLAAIGCPREEMESALRFSFCADNTEEEVDTLLDAVKELLPQLAKYTRR